MAESKNIRWIALHVFEHGEIQTESFTADEWSSVRMFIDIAVSSIQRYLTVVGPERIIIMNADGTLLLSEEYRRNEPGGELLTSVIADNSPRDDSHRFSD